MYFKVILTLEFQLVLNDNLSFFHASCGTSLKRTMVAEEVKPSYAESQQCIRSCACLWTGSLIILPIVTTHYFVMPFSHMCEEIPYCTQVI